MRVIVDNCRLICSCMCLIIANPCLSNSKRNNYLWSVSVVVSIIYINTNEKSGELLRENLISSHVTASWGICTRELHFVLFAQFFNTGWKFAQMKLSIRPKWMQLLSLMFCVIAACVPAHNLFTQSGIFSSQWGELFNTWATSLMLICIHRTVSDGI